MIFAAGLGTRLRPLTDRIPKALVPVAGVPVLERVARRLVETGADRLIINVHYFADAIEAFVERKRGFGVDCRVSREDAQRLETGGGLVAAREHFRGDAPFIMHNADIVTRIDLRGMYDAHLRTGALATLACMERDSTRALLFDDDGLYGRVGRDGQATFVRESMSSEPQTLGFSGVHVASPELLDQIEETGVFSIIDPYLRLAAEGAKILPHRVDDALWMDIGTPERLAEADRVLAGQLAPLT